VKITTEAKRLKEALTIINRVTPSRTTLPITSMALIEALNGQVVIKATDLEIAGGFMLPSDILEQGECMVDPKRALLFAKGEKGIITITSIGDEVVLSSSSGKVTLPSLTKELPDLKQVCSNVDSVNAEFELPDGLVQALSYVLPCAATEESRPVLTGVVFRFKGEKLSLAAADGFRLAVAELDHDVTEPFELIVPAKALGLVSKMKGDIWFGYNGADRVAFYSDGVKILSQTIQGTFPQHEQLIPDKPPTWKIVCSGKTVKQRLSQIKASGSGIIRMTMDGEFLALTSKSEEEQDMTMTVPAVFTGEGYIAVNQKYLSVAAGIFDEVTIEVTAPSSPLKMYGSVDGLLYVVMPMFVQW